MGRITVGFPEKTIKSRTDSLNSISQFLSHSIFIVKHSSFKGTAFETRQLWNLISTVTKHNRESARSTVLGEASAASPWLYYPQHHAHTPAFSGACTLASVTMAPVSAPKHLGSRGEVLVICPPRPPTRSGPGAGYLLPLNVHSDCCVRVLTWTQKPSSLRACLFSCIIHSSTFSTQQ